MRGIRTSPLKLAGVTQRPRQSVAFPPHSMLSGLGSVGCGAPEKALLPNALQF